MPDNCIFCNVVDKNLIYQDKRGTVLSSNPIRAGHVMIGCNRHKPFLHDISGQECIAFFELVNEVAKVIVRTTGAEKVYMFAIGDIDHHFHVHLTPKFSQDVWLGSYILGDDGWAGALSSPSKPEEINSLNKSIFNGLSAQ